MTQQRSQVISTAQLEVIETYPAGRLVHRGDEHGGEVSLVDHRGVVGFRLDYRMACVAGLGRCATQVTSWRGLYAGVKGLANRVLDRFLLVRFDTIVSDSQRTGDAERFWRIQLSGAATVRTIGRIVDGDIQVCSRGADVEGWFATAPKADHCLFISNLTRRPDDL